MRLIGRRRKRNAVNVEGLRDLQLRVTVLKAKGLVGADKMPVNCPYVVVRCNHYRFSTHAANKTQEPEWNTEFVVPLARFNSEHGVSIKVWDKDRIRKNYIGEVLIELDEIFPAFKALPKDDPANKPRWIPLNAIRYNTSVNCGQIEVAFALEATKPGVESSKLWNELLLEIDRIRPPSKQPSVAGTLDSLDFEDEIEDIESEEEEGEEEGEDEDVYESPYEDESDDELELDELEGSPFPDMELEQKEGEAKVPVPAPAIQVIPGSPLPPSKQQPPALYQQAVPQRGDKRKTRKARHFEFTAASSVVGVTFLDIIKATDLPPERNMTRMGFDMDPFVVVSFGKKTFRTAWRRHTLNPVFNEKLLFPVRRHEQNFSINFTVMDKDRITLNDFVADVELNIQELIKNSPRPDLETGLYEPESLTSYPLEPEETPKKRRGIPRISSFRSFRSSRAQTPEASASAPNTNPIATPAYTEGSGSSSSVDEPTNNKTDGRIRNLLDPNAAETLASAFKPQDEEARQHKTFILPLKLRSTKYEDKCSPQIYIRGRFLPYAALRQHFWRGLMRTYDIDDTGALSYLELTTMLDSLGSTLSRKTKEGYFERFNRPLTEELTIDEVVICLEDQIIKDSIEERRRRESLATTDTDSISAFDEDQEMALSSDAGNGGSNQPAIGPSSVPVPVAPISVASRSPSIGSTGTGELASSLPLSKASFASNFSLDAFSDAEDNGKFLERVIQISSCPGCNQPRLGKRTEIDIVTHLAICADQNWAKVDALIMDRYVSSDQARKRWYSKIVSKVSYGNYKLGANSANILVQDRMTGYVMEEKMSVYVRLGIRLLYKGMRSSRMETRRVRAMLRTLSIKQGRKYDNPASVQSIRPFIKFHNLNMDEVLEAIENFKTFNEFFYRKLKPDARKCDAPHNPKIAVSAADCRTTMFKSVSKAQQIWIKGREFSIARLFGDAYPDMVDKFEEGSLAIFRLAPQDYHRFHTPVDGVVGEPKTIQGEYYTVNPMAIRSALDVYGENVRVLVPMETEHFGTVMIVCVGAMMVGSTVITAKKGDRLNRMDELGYFQFGGSTLVILFEPGRIKFDEDLTENSDAAVETLVRVGMSIGHHPDHPEWERHDIKDPNLVSQEEKERAMREIVGGGTGEMYLT
ncbi:phosphatidylserine decarboxylase proenzyme 2 [Trichomonascus vanleenenianus]|uniref:phosphatidylserine decarboxylase 2 n=1 Tax=Trichomonascus vanleenenianus TaxID=2268995 RepID=UPI003EC9AB84